MKLYKLYQLPTVVVVREASINPLVSSDPTETPGSIRLQLGAVGKSDYSLWLGNYYGVIHDD